MGGIPCGSRDLRILPRQHGIWALYYQVKRHDGNPHILRGVVCDLMHIGSAMCTRVGRGDCCRSYTGPTGWASLVWNAPLTLHHPIFQQVYSVSILCYHIANVAKCFLSHSGLSPHLSGFMSVFFLSVFHRGLVSLRRPLGKDTAVCGSVGNKSLTSVYSSVEKTS